jgi:maltose O-acetyltransferase
MHRLIYRAVRRLVIRPTSRWMDTQEIALQLEHLQSIGRGCVIKGPLRLDDPSRTVLGDDVCINPGLVVRGGGRLVIGSHTHFGQDVRVILENHRIEGTTELPYDKHRIQKGVEIGECVWVGDRAVIVPGVRIGLGAVVAAGAVVTREVPELAIVGGSPAEVIRFRDRTAFETLRHEGKYLGWPRDHHLINGSPIVLRGPSRRRR